MNTIKTKRPYHHSEAWLKKHAAKKQMAQKPAKKAAKKAPKKEAVKKTSKKMKKQMARKPAMKVEKKPTIKKLTMQNAVTFFNRNKKHVSNIKTCMKELNKFLTEVFKTGDEKYISRVLKLFERLGFVYDSASKSVTFAIAANVKLPKVKTEKPTADEKKPRVKRQPKDDDKSSASAEPAPVIAKPVAPAPEPEDVSAELDTQDAEEELAELALTEKREDEDDDEFRERMREEQEIERAAEEEEDETRAEIFEAQEENGDFS